MSGKKDHLDYGEGQRAQYGEGSSHRTEEKTRAVDKSASHAFAGGRRRGKRLPDPRRPDGERK